MRIARRDREDDHAEPEDETAPVDVETDEPAEEPFKRYQNSLYRLFSMGGAAMVAVIGVTGFAIGRTLDPIPPASFFVVDAIVTVLLLGWYLLGMRCRLDVAESWVHVATKYSDTRIDRDRVVSIEPDRSLRGLLQLGGRPLILRYSAGESDDKIKVRRAHGCLPNESQSQIRVIEELQDLLGHPDDIDDAEDARRSGRARRLGRSVPEPGEDVDRLQEALAARLATMEPEGTESADGGATPGDDPDSEPDHEA